MAKRLPYRLLRRLATGILTRIHRALGIKPSTPGHLFVPRGHLCVPQGHLFMPGVTVLDQGASFCALGSTFCTPTKLNLHLIDYKFDYDYEFNESGIVCLEGI